MSQAPPVDVTRTAPETEISLGRELRRAREVRGISIEQIARETKINERYLHALESDRLDLLPGQLYARNFVRSVARTIGADEEELLDYFNYQVRLQDDQVSSRDEGRSGIAARRGLVLSVLAVAAILLVALLTYALREAEQAEPAPSRQRAASLPAAGSAPAGGSTTVAPSGVAGSPESGAGSPGSAQPPVAAPATAARPVPPVLLPSQPSTSQPEPAQGVVEATPGGAAPGGAAAAALPAPSLRLSFADASWVEIQREGEDEPLVGMKQKGETMMYALDRPITLTLLNSAGVSISVDGQPFRALGGPQEKRTITVDRKNYSQYLKK